MRILKIENSKGYFLSKDGNYLTIDNITKEDLLGLVDLALEDETTFDEYNEDQLKNQAHQIIYKSIYEKIEVLNASKEKFIDESRRLYLKEYERYNSNEEKEGEA